MLLPGVLHHLVASQRTVDCTAIAVLTVNTVLHVRHALPGALLWARKDQHMQYAGDCCCGVGPALDLSVSFYIMATTELGTPRSWQCCLSCMTGAV